ncbi:hypothetical protein V6N11_030784 [Hibiscus sabdariffa]|uniref:Uncharacterized protein n=1 Tax=Hibiscus sabdariffa TaxID=183260 RepID=A0ABR2N734_9ROSI
MDNGGDQLFDVHVEGGSVSNASSGHSVTIEPVFDPISGLYSVKPKLLSLSLGNHMFEFPSKFNNRYPWSVASPSKSKNHVSSLGKDIVTHSFKEVRVEDSGKQATNLQKESVAKGVLHPKH